MDSRGSIAARRHVGSIVEIVSFETDVVKSRTDVLLGKMDHIKNSVSTLRSKEFGDVESNGSFISRLLQFLMFTTFIYFLILNVSDKMS